MNQVEVVIDHGLGFTLGEFPEGFAASDLAHTVKSMIVGLRSIWITTPRIKPVDDPNRHTYDFHFRGSIDGKPWGYVYRVSEHEIRDWVGGPVFLNEARLRSMRPTIRQAADLMAREINAAVQQRLAGN